MIDVNLSFVEALIRASNLSLPGGDLPDPAGMWHDGREYDLSVPHKSWNISISPIGMRSPLGTYRCNGSELCNNTGYDNGNGSDVSGDGEIKPNPLPLVELVVYSLLAGISSVVTVVGNLIVILSFILERSIRQPSNYFICSLALSDLLIGCFSMPLYTVYLVMGKYWPMGEVICDLWLSVDYQVCLTSIYTVFFITVDRFCSVKMPAKYRGWRTEQKVKLMVAATWVIPILLFFTSIIGWQFFVGKRTVLKGHCYVQFMEDGIFNAVLVICYYWVTLIVICILYTGIYKVALDLQKKSEAKHKKMATLVSMAGQTATRIGMGVCKSNQLMPPGGAEGVDGSPGQQTKSSTTTTSFTKSSNTTKGREEEDRSSSPAFPSDSEPTPTDEPAAADNAPDTPPKKRKFGKGHNGVRKTSNNSKQYDMIPQPVVAKETAHVKRSSLPNHVLSQVDSKCLFVPIPTINDTSNNDNNKDNGTLRRKSYCTSNGREKHYSGDRLLSAMDAESASLMSDCDVTMPARVPTFSTFRDAEIGDSGGRMMRASTPDLPAMPCPSPLPLPGDDADEEDVDVEELSHLADRDSLQSLCSTNQIADIQDPDDHDLDAHAPRYGLDEDPIDTHVVCSPFRSPDSPIWKRRSSYMMQDSNKIVEQNDTSPKTGACHTNSSDHVTVPAVQVRIDGCDSAKTVTELAESGRGGTADADTEHNTANASAKSSPLTSKPKATNLVKKVTTTSKPRTEKQKSKSEIRGRKALRTITFILGAFVLCWTPYHILVVIYGFCASGDCINITLYDISYFMCYMNSPINPLCYALANAQFKKTFLRILRLDWHRT